MRIATDATCQLTISLVSSAITPDMTSHCKSYSVDFKWQVLASLWLNNENISQTARQHTVYTENWCRDSTSNKKNWMLVHLQES